MHSQREKKDQEVQRSVSARSVDFNSYLFARRVCLLCSPVIVGYLLEPRNPRTVQEASRQTKEEVSNRGDLRVESHVRLPSCEVAGRAVPDAGAEKYGTIYRIR